MLFGRGYTSLYGFDLANDRGMYETIGSVVPDKVRHWACSGIARDRIRFRITA